MKDERKDYYVIVDTVAWGPYYSEADAKLVRDKLGVGEVVKTITGDFSYVSKT